MYEKLDAASWERFAKATGFAGCLALVLVLFAAKLNGGFDWGVFLLSVSALFICWARTWLLVPIHLRNERAETDEWNRFMDSDWKFVDAVSSLSGTEIDDLRSIFERGQDREARAYVQKNFSAFDSDETQGFVRFFNETFVNEASAFIDEQGRLQPND